MCTQNQPWWPSFSLDFNFVSGFESVKKKNPWGIWAIHFLCEFFKTQVPIFFSLPSSFLSLCSFPSKKPVKRFPQGSKLSEKLLNDILLDISHLVTVGCGNRLHSGTMQASSVKSSIKPWSFSVGTKENCDCHWNSLLSSALCLKA